MLHQPDPLLVIVTILFTVFLIVGLLAVCVGGVLELLGINTEDSE